MTDAAGVVGEGSGDSRPQVTVHVASYNTAASTELCVRTLRATAGMPFELVVGDSGSRDGSVEMLRDLANRGWFTLQEAPGVRQHTEWLDLWIASCPTLYAVFADSDVIFHRTGWLAEMVQRAAEGNALVTGEWVPARTHFQGPVREAYLAARPAPWLMLVRCDAIRKLRTSFGYYERETDERPEGLIAYDTASRLFIRLQEAGLEWAQMPPQFRRSYEHIGNLSWRSQYSRNLRDRWDAFRIRRLLLQARRRDPGDGDR